VTDGEEAILVPPGDDERLAAALRSMLATPDLRARCGGAARRRASASLTVERMADEYEQLYRAAQRR
jgi:glycosyltransferase involved in cell wall biosynthesis